MTTHHITSGTLFECSNSN